jgi:hypothetical protein
MDNITVHSDIEVPKGLSKIPHTILKDSIVDRLEAEGLTDHNGYYFKDNSFYWFLYSKGKRLDIPLNGFHSL